jgi:uncharacterized protein (TIGR03437 family)
MNMRRLTVFLGMLGPLLGFPLHFEPNVGQVKGRTEWMAQARGASVYITGREVVFALGNDNAHMRFVGASRTSKSTGIEPLEAYSSYFIGPTERTWFTGVPHYGSLRYSNVYPGIDIVYRSSDTDVEYDFVLAPGADPDQIDLAFDREVHIDPQGDLVAGTLRQHRPRVVQEGREIASEYQLTPNNHVHIKLARYGRQGALTIDPVLEFSTYLGGPGDDSLRVVRVDGTGNLVLGGSGQVPATPTLDPFQQTNAIASGAWLMKLTPDAKRVLYYTFLSTGGFNGLQLDSDGDLWVTGGTQPGSIPLKNAFQSACVDSCGFIGKLSPDGRSLIFFSYLSPGGLQLDQDGNAFIVGTTEVPNLPTKNPIQLALNGYQDCFISKVSSTGAWIFSTYFGSTGLDACPDGAIGKDGSVLFTGYTSSAEFPLKDAPQTQSNPGPFGAVFLVKMAPDGQSVILSTYIGGDNFSGGGNAIATDQAGNIYVVGRAFNPFMTFKNPYQTYWRNDGYGFVMKFDPSGKNLIYSTFFGTWFFNVAVDKDQNVYGIGLATNAEIPLKGSFQEFIGGGVTNSDASVTKFGSLGTTLAYSTLIGGNNTDWPLGITVDSDGNAYVGGFTYSPDFPVKNAYQPKFGGGKTDAFFIKISDNSGSTASSPLQPTPARASFLYVQGGPTPATQSVAVTGTEGYFLTTSPIWISAQPSGPGPPNNVQIAVNPAGLAPGTYTGAVILHPLSGAAVATIDVSVTVYATAPVLTSLDPALVAIGSDDVPVTVHGSGFAPGAKLLVGSVPWVITPVTIVNSTTLTFKFPKFYFTGETNYPITVQNPQSLSSNGLSLAVGNPAPVIANGGILNAASYAAPPVAVGEMVVIFGSNFGAIDATNVLFQHLAGKVIYVTPTQLVATVPAGAGNRSSIIVEVQTSHDVYSAPVTVDMAPSAPALFTSDASGKGQAAAINQDNSVNDAGHPALAGSVVALYATGGGALTTDALPRVILPVSATMGGFDAPVLYAGIAPGQPDGMIQINIQVPAGLPSGTAGIVVKIGDASSQGGVTLAVK